MLFLTLRVLAFCSALAISFGQLVENNLPCFPPNKIKGGSYHLLNNGKLIIYFCFDSTGQRVPKLYTSICQNGQWDQPIIEECPEEAPTLFRFRRSPNTGKFEALKRQEKVQRKIKEGLLETSIDYNTPTILRVHPGSRAFLLCRVENLGTHSVVWKFQGKVLSIDTSMISPDKRFTPSHDEETGTWLLEIKRVRLIDAGDYTCQVSSKTPLNHVVTLQVIPNGTPLLPKKGKLRRKKNINWSSDMEEVKANVTAMWKEISQMKVLIHAHVQGDQVLVDHLLYHHRESESPKEHPVESGHHHLDHHHHGDHSHKDHQGEGHLHEGDHHMEGNETHIDHHHHLEEHHHHNESEAHHEHGEFHHSELDHHHHNESDAHHEHGEVHHSELDHHHNESDTHHEHGDLHHSEHHHHLEHSHHEHGDHHHHHHSELDHHHHNESDAQLEHGEEPHSELDHHHHHNESDPHHEHGEAHHEHGEAHHAELDHHHHQEEHHLNESDTHHEHGGKHHHSELDHHHHHMSEHNHHIDGHHHHHESEHHHEGNDTLSGDHHHEGEHPHGKDHHHHEHGVESNNEHGEAHHYEHGDAHHHEHGDAHHHERGDAHHHERGDAHHHEHGEAHHHERGDAHHHERGDAHHHEHGDAHHHERGDAHHHEHGDAHHHERGDAHHYEHGDAHRHEDKHHHHGEEEEEHNHVDGDSSSKNAPDHEDNQPEDSHDQQNESGEDSGEDKKSGKGRRHVHSHGPHHHQHHYHQHNHEDHVNKAHCNLFANAELPFTNISGHVFITQKNNGPTRFKISLADLSVAEDGSDRLHGFHIHESPIINRRCSTAGPHFNPEGQTHGSPDSLIRHVGDLGNVEVDALGNLESFLITDKKASLSGPNSIIGRSIVVHSLADDFGLGGDAGSLATGNAGARLACCIIEGEGEQFPSAPVGISPTIRFNG